MFHIWPDTELIISLISKAGNNPSRAKRATETKALNSLHSLLAAVSRTQKKRLNCWLKQSVGTYVRSLLYIRVSHAVAAWPHKCRKWTKKQVGGVSCQSVIFITNKGYDVDTCGSKLKLNKWVIKLQFVTHATFASPTDKNSWPELKCFTDNWLLISFLGIHVFLKSDKNQTILDDP